jgi:hypothetical protein
VSPEQSDDGSNSQLSSAERCSRCLSVGSPVRTQGIVKSIADIVTPQRITTVTIAAVTTQRYRDSVLLKSSNFVKYASYQCAFVYFFQESDQRTGSKAPSVSKPISGTDCHCLALLLGE